MQAKYKLLSALLITSTAFAAKPEPVYQIGVFRALHVSQIGSYCNSHGDTNGSVLANTDQQGNTSGNINATTTTHTDCTPRTQYEYTVSIGEQTLVLTPKTSAVQIISFGFSNYFHSSTLYGKLPGETIQLRSEGSTIYVKSGKKESAYVMIGSR